MRAMIRLVLASALTRPMALLLVAALLALASVAMDTEVAVGMDGQAGWRRGMFLARTVTCVVVIFFGAMQIATELTDKSAIVWLTRPLSRRRYLLAKFIGVAMVGWLLLIAQALALAGMLAFHGIYPDANLLATLLSSGLWLTALAALAVALSGWLGYMSAGMFTGVVAIASFVCAILPIYARTYDDSLPGYLLAGLMWVIYLPIPNAEHYDVTHWLDAGLARWIKLLLYTLSLCALYLVLGVGAIEKRDLT